MLKEEHPQVAWPDGARLAVMLSFDFQGKIGTRLLPGNKKDYFAITESEYGARVGIWRILDLLDEYQIKATFPTCGATAELYPEATREIKIRDHEVAVHAYEHEDLYTLTRQQEESVMEKAIASIEKVIGERPRGWRSPLYRPSENTVELLFNFDFVWHSDFHNDDIPYLLEGEGKRIVEIPAYLDDWGYYMGAGFTLAAPRGSPENILNIFRDGFDLLYRESALRPKIYVSCMHPLIIGRPHMIGVLEKLIKHMKGFYGVWFARGIDIARLLLPSK